MEFQLKEILVHRAGAWLGVEINPDWIQFQPTRKDVKGDLTLMVFPFAKALKCAPAEAAKTLGESLKTRWILSKITR